MVDSSQCLLINWCRYDAILMTFITPYQSYICNLVPQIPIPQVWQNYQTLQASHDTWVNNGRSTDEDEDLQQDGKEGGGGRW